MRSNSPLFTVVEFLRGWAASTSQLVRAGPHPSPFELVLSLDFDIRHHYGQHYSGSRATGFRGGDHSVAAPISFA